MIPVLNIDYTPQPRSTRSLHALAAGYSALLIVWAYAAAFLGTYLHNTLGGWAVWGAAYGFVGGIVVGVAAFTVPAGRTRTYVLAAAAAIALIGCLFAAYGYFSWEPPTYDLRELIPNRHGGVV